MFVAEAKLEQQCTIAFLLTLNFVVGVITTTMQGFIFAHTRLFWLEKNWSSMARVHFHSLNIVAQAKLLQSFLYALFSFFTQT